MTAPVVGFTGMTHLGLVSGLCAADAGFRVVCFDPDDTRVAPMRRGELPVSEPGLDELAAVNARRVTFTSSAAELSACDVIYVAPDVPTDDQGRSDLAPIDAMLATVFAAARPDAVIVVLSQVPPGYTRSKRRPGRLLYYQVETLIFGRAVERARQPERYIVGCEDTERPPPAAYATVLAAPGCPVLKMRYESAELSKIAINMCLVAMVSTANTLAELCEKIGADWSEIVPALRLDRRIGQHSYLAPGLGIAGGNLERDLATVMRLAERNGTDAGVVRAWVQNSDRRRNWAVAQIRAALLDARPGATIAVWGLVYKENTHSTKNSPSLATIGQLGNARVRVHDPVVAAPVPVAAEQAADPLEAVAGADALMILTPWPVYRTIAPASIARALRGRIVIDPYCMLDPAAAAAAGLDHYTLGRPPARVEGR